MNNIFYYNKLTKILAYYVSFYYLSRNGLTALTNFILLVNITLILNFSSVKK